MASEYTFVTVNVRFYMQVIRSNLVASFRVLSRSAHFGQIDPVYPADPRNGTRRSGGSDRIVWHAPKRRSKLIEYGGRLSNVLTACFYTNNGRCIGLSSQNDAMACDYYVILQKSTSLIPSPFLF